MTPALVGRSRRKARNATSERNAKTRSHGLSVRSGSIHRTVPRVHPCNPDTTEAVRVLGRRLLQPAGSEGDSVVVVAELMETAEGCNWLRKRWGEIQGRIDTGQPWASAGLSKFVRLLGKEPIEAVNDPQLNGVFLAWDMIEPGSGCAFWEACRERAVREGSWLAECMTWREITSGPRDRAHAVAILTAIVRQEIEKLEAMAADLESLTRMENSPNEAIFSLAQGPDALILKLKKWIEERERTNR